MKLILNIAAILCFVACQTSSESVTNTVFTKDKNRTPYEEVLKTYSRSTTVYSNYETLYNLNVSAFSNKFYESFKTLEAERFVAMDPLKDIKINSSFFVSIYSPYDNYTDLTNSRLWEFVLSVDGKEYPSKLVKKLKDKEAWCPFFPYVNRWSTDYIISFDIPDSEKIQSYALSLTNAHAKTVMKW